MSTILEDRYRDRYSRPHIRDEVVLRTACGCEKIVSVPVYERVLRVSIQINPPGPVMDWKGDVTYTIRTFIFDGEFDRARRRVFQERVRDTRNWEHMYHQLYKEVYGMDEGL